MQSRVVSALRALSIASFLAGCSGYATTGIGTPSAVVPQSHERLTRSARPNVPAPEYVYVTNAGSGNVSAFSIGAGGLLTAVSGSPFAAATGTRGVAVGVNKYLYAANTGSNNVSAWKITSSTGGLTSVGGPFAAGTSPDGVASKGKCLFVANGGSNNVSAFKIQGNGALTLVANYSAGTSPEMVAADPAAGANYVYATNENSNNITAFKMAGTCKLKMIGTYSTGSGSGPFGVAVDPTGAYLVVANFYGSSVSYFNIGSSGALTFAGTTSTNSDSPVGVAISGGYAFVTNQYVDWVAAYTSPGTPFGTPYATDVYPQGIAIDPTGSFAYVADEMSNDVSGYTVSGGVLTATSPATFGAGTGPEFVATCQKVGGSCKPPPL